MVRAAATAVALLLLSGVQLADALAGGSLVSTPAFLLGSALAGYLVGATVRWPVAAAMALLSAAALTAAHQLDSPGAYPLLDDFVFSLLTVGAPALGGAVVRARAEQVRELRRVARLLSTQREAEVRAAQLEERNRLQMQLHHGFSEQVAAIAMRAESAVGADDDSTRSALAEVETAARSSLDELRAALGSLRAAPAVAPAPVEVDGAVPDEPVGRADLALAAVIGAALAVESLVSPQAQGPAAPNVLVALLVGAPFVVRRQRPLTACALSVAALGLMAAWLTPPAAMVTSIFPLLLCGYVVGAHVAGARRLLGVGVVLGGLGLSAVLGRQGLPEASALVPMLVFLALALLVGTVSAGWSARAAQLRAAVAELERGRDVDVGLAVAEQRSRLASELHDTVAHAMTVICLQASAGQVRPEPGRLEAILASARTGLDELRNGLDNLGDEQELGLAGITAQATRAGLRPEVRVRGRVEDLRPDTRQLAARLVREALTNAGRYAPGSRVRVEVVADQVLRVSVDDDGGAGAVADDLGAGSGLRGLAAEVERNGGSMSWGRRGDGFHVEVTLPGSAVLV